MLTKNIRVHLLHSLADYYLGLTGVVIQLVPHFVLLIKNLGFYLLEQLCILVITVEDLRNVKNLVDHSLVFLLYVFNSSRLEDIHDELKVFGQVFFRFHHESMQVVDCEISLKIRPFQQLKKLVL